MRRLFTIVLLLLLTPANPQGCSDKIKCRVVAETATARTVQCCDRYDCSTYVEAR